MVVNSEKDVEKFFNVQEKYEPGRSMLGWMSVKELRELVESNKNVFSKRKAVYTWWFKENCVNKFLKPLVDKGLLIASIVEGNFPGFEGKYRLLYVGIAADDKDGVYARFKWHIMQKHSFSNISNGILSTLRRTISSLLFCSPGYFDKKGILLNIDGSVNEDAEKFLNKFMDDNCILQWFEFDDVSKQQLENLETKVIEHWVKGGKTGYFPLNIQKNWIYNKKVNKKNENLSKHYLIKQELINRRKKVCGK